MTTKSIEESIKLLKKEIVKLEAIRLRFPDAEFVKAKNAFKSKTVNSDFDDVIFSYDRWRLLCGTVAKINYIFDNKTEEVLIYSSPIKNVLIHKRKDYHSKKTKIWFSRFAINLKGHNFPDHLIDKCRKEMIKFISEDPSIIIDMKHIDPKIRKLLSFA